MKDLIQSIILARDHGFIDVGETRRLILKAIIIAILSIKKKK